MTTSTQQKDRAFGRGIASAMNADRCTYAGAIDIIRTYAEVTYSSRTRADAACVEARIAMNTTTRKSGGAA